MQLFRLIFFHIRNYDTSHILKMFQTSFITISEREKISRLRNNFTCQFHQHFTFSFCVCWAQKRKKDSQVISLFTLSGSEHMLVKLTPGCLRLIWLLDVAGGEIQPTTFPRKVSNKKEKSEILEANCKVFLLLLLWS